MEVYDLGKVTLTVKTGDITSETTDAIVNAANSSLLGGAGVDGAIHRKGGPSILAECRILRRDSFPDGLPTGEAVITNAGDLPSKFVIHTVGPVYGSEKGLEAKLLEECYRNSLLLADKHEICSVSFPAISTGAYGFPKDLAAKTAVRAIRKASGSLSFVNSVTLIFFGESDKRIFIKNSGL